MALWPDISAAQQQFRNGACTRLRCTYLHFRCNVERREPRVKAEAQRWKQTPGQIKRSVQFSRVNYSLLRTWACDLPPTVGPDTAHVPFTFDGVRSIESGVGVTKQNGHLFAMQSFGNNDQKKNKNHNRAESNIHRAIIFSSARSKGVLFQLFAITISGNLCMPGNSEETSACRFRFITSEQINFELSCYAFWMLCSMSFFWQVYNEHNFSLVWFCQSKRKSFRLYSNSTRNSLYVYTYIYIYAIDCCNISADQRSLKDIYEDKPR